MTTLHVQLCLQHGTLSVGQTCFVQLDNKRSLCMQVEVHCHFRNERVIDWCKKESIHVTAYAPLSSPQTMSSQNKTVPNLLKVWGSHIGLVQRMVYSTKLKYM